MADMIEYGVTNDALTVASELHICTNFAEVKEWLTQELAPYESMIVTEESIASAKTLRANIRKVADSINQQKISVKKAWLAPFTTFEGESKELYDLCQKSVTNLDVQIKNMENAKREEKLARLKTVFDENAVGITDYVTWDSIVSPKWGNASASEKAAAEEIVTILRQVREDLDTIRSLNSEWEEALLDEYAATHNVRDAIQKENALKARKAAEEARKAAAVQEHFDEPKAAQDEPDAPVETPATFAPPPVVPVGYEEPTKPKLYRLEFAVDVTMEQAHALKAFFTQNHIEYRKI